MEKYIALTISLAATLVGLAGCMTIGRAPSGIEAEADSLLRAMSAKLAAAEQFSFRTERSVDPALVPGREVRAHARIQVSVSRPDRIRAQIRSGEGNREFFYDGAEVVVSDMKTNHYASVPAPATIDKVIDEIQEKWGVHPPMADFLVANPYRSLTGGVTSGTVVGSATVGGVSCQHLRFEQPGVVWEIWVARSDSLPRKFLITLPEGEMSATLSHWNLDDPRADSYFRPVVGKNARKIEMLPLD